MDWREYYAREVERLEFEGREELLARIATAGKLERNEWLGSTQAQLTQVRDGLMGKLDEDVLRSVEWNRARGEYCTLLRLCAALRGENPDWQAA
jgi:hypothetical protein